MPDTRVAVRAARPNDLTAALRLTNAEGWGYQPADLERLLSLAGRGFLVAEDAGEIGGCLTVLLHGSAAPAAWIGNVVVAAERRGTGVGLALMESALSLCDEAAAAHVYLEAFPPAITFYLRLGFVEEALTHRFHRAARAPGASAIAAHAAARRIGAGDLDAVCAADRAVFGADRGALLRRLAADYPGTCWFAPSGAASDAAAAAPGAWLLARPAGPSAELGPWCGAEPAARAVFAHALAALGDRSLELSAPDDNPAARRALEEAGFAIVGYHVRMRRGAPVAWDRARTWALGGLEKG